jgi:mannose-6-phosphate isomerase-like protein (cupin superfamily)
MEINSPVIAQLLAGSTLGTGKDSFVIAEWRDPGGPPAPPRFIAPLHLHHNDDEAWYVLEGALAVRVGDRDVAAQAGEAVFVPRGTAHTYWNPGPGVLRYLLVMTPRIFELIQEIHATKERTPAVLRAVFQKYDSELL